MLRMRQRPLAERLLHAAHTANTHDTFTVIVEKLPVEYPVFLLLGMLLLLASNRSQLVIAVGGIVLYVVYASFWSYVSARFNLETNRQWQLIRSVVAIVLIALGLSLAGQEQITMWLLFVIPLWRVAEYDETNGRMFVSVFLLEVLLLAVVTWQAWRADPALQIVTRVASRALWLSFFAFQISLISRFIEYSDKGKIKRQQDYHSLFTELFRVSDLQEWCDAVARYCLKLTRASYCTVQTCDYKNDNLRMEVALSAVGPKHGEIVQLNPHTNGIGLPDMKFFERQDGITAKVARGGTTICVADVSRTKHPYHEFFPKVRSEIAVPLFDFVRGAPGGVINVEYTDEDSPKSGRMLETYTRLLEEVADTVGAAYSSFLMSVQSEAMHTLALKLPTLRTEDDLLQSVVQELSSLYLCPVVIWSPISQDDPSLLMPRAFTDELPESWGRHKSKPQLRLGTSPLHSILIDNDAVYVSDIEDKAVAHWRTYARLGLRSALVTPIADITGQRGMIEICTRTRCQFLPYEVRLLEQLAGQVGYELERIRLANESVERILRQPVTAVVHDIKGPIERIPVWIDMIEQNCQLETPSCHEILVALQEESSYLESIAGLMPIQLEFSLAGAIPTERFDVFALLEEAVNSMQKHRVIEKDQVKWHGKRDPVYVRGNRAIARGIFSNLVINAARAMREEQPKKQSLSIAIVKPEGSDSVFLRFANSSSRLPSQILERLVRFQPIFERNSSGGFGLATYAKLVSAMGGQLEFSQEPWGLVFQVVLPLSKEA